MLILSVAVVIAGCATPQNSTDPANNSDGTTTPNNETENTVISHTDTGFVPETVRIEKGETVVWKSETGNMWIASNQHPRHTEYSGTSRTEHCQNGDQNTAAFDQCSAGEEFSFTFEKEGEWNYHNHESALEGGTVVVR